MAETTELMEIAEKNGLVQSKADALLASFEEYFRLAGEWERTARELVVTDASQVEDMKKAREGRLFLKEKRVALEKTRKALKEQSLREGKAIDGMANVIKALIVPIEQHLDDQEHFVERQAAVREAEIRAEIMERKKAEEQAQREWLAAEQEQIRAENARLREEAAARDAELRAEREKTEAVARKAKAIITKEREEKAAQEAAAADAAEQARKAEAELAEEREKKAALARQIEEAEKDVIECPLCGHRWSQSGRPVRL